MPHLRLEAYGPDRAEEWDDFVATADAGTFLHTRRYLAHHGDRFAEHGLLIRDASKGRLLGLLPAATVPGDEGTVVSHPGLSYGGVLHAGRLSGPAMEDALAAATEHFAARGHTSFVYRAVPHVYHVRPAQDDLLALHRLGARLQRRDLSATIDLHAPRRISEQRKRAFRRAASAGVQISDDADTYLDAFWTLLTDRLAERHAVRPVHTLDGIRGLHDRFASTGEIGFLGALDGTTLIAGTLLFRTPRVHHAQYIASTARGDEIGALDAVFTTAIDRAARAGARFFDFGHSSRDQSGTINAGLYRFKRGFGAGGAVCDRYVLDLTATKSS